MPTLKAMVKSMRRGRGSQLIVLIRASSSRASSSSLHKKYVSVFYAAKKSQIFTGIYIYAVLIIVYVFAL